MSKKQKLQSILNKLKSWSESSGDEVLNGHLNELEDEINTTADEGDDEEEDGGGANHPTEPPGKP